MLFTIILIILVVLVIASLFYRPFGTGYTSYGPSGVLILLVVILLLLFLFHVI